MRPDPWAFLWDARNSADAIARLISGKRLEDYLSDELLRPAVERQFEIVGEALSHS